MVSPDLSRLAGLPVVGVAILLCLLAAGCGGAPGKSKLKIKHGQSQSAPAGSALKTALRVVALQRVPGMLGGKGSEVGVPDVEVTFEVVGGAENGLLYESEAEQQAGAPGAGKPRLVLKTGTGGTAAVYMVLGKVARDVFVRATSEHGEVEFRAASGLKIEGAGQEGGAGKELGKPIRVRVSDAAGDPVPGAVVIFTLQKHTEKAKVGTIKIRTDEDGRAESTLKLGTETGLHSVDVQVSTPGTVYQPIGVKAFAISGWSIFLRVAGGLAIFIWGMRMMSDGLRRVAGAKLRSILQALVRNRFSGVMVGAGVTALVQSSSAVSVMVVGFVNAGLMNLEQAIATIMGANIGTTVTAQIISFKLDALALPAIAIGVLVYMLARRRTLRFWAEVLIGFGFLFLGMRIMGDSLKILKDSPSIEGMFTTISCAPLTAGGSVQFSKALLAVLLGTFVTFAVQSSSASIGLLLSLAGAGLLDYYTVVPILLGDNIGTTITAQLAAIGANRTARQTAHAHTLFNLLGTTVIFASFFIRWHGVPVYHELVNQFTSGNAWNGENLERHIANAHTTFNVVNVLLQLPFIAVIALICRRLTRDTGEDDEEVEFVYLEPHLLETPTLALERVRAELIYMLQLARKSIDETYRALHDKEMPARLLEKIQQREDKIDQRQHSIADYLQQLTQRTLTEKESHAVPPLIHAVNDLERVGDHAENLLELHERINEHRIEVPEDARAELDQMYDALTRMFGHAERALETQDPQAARRVLESEDEINAYEHNLSQANTSRIESRACSAAAGIIYQDVVVNFEKIGDHLTNVAQSIVDRLAAHDTPTGEEAADEEVASSQ